MGILFSDNAATTLAAGISDTDTIITVAPSAGANFPAVTGGSGNYFVITLEDAMGNREFVKVEHRSGDTFGSVGFPCTRGFWNDSGKYPPRSWTPTTVVDIRWSANAITATFTDHFSAAVTSINQLTPSADKYIYYTSSTAASLGTITAYARTILDDADQPTAFNTICGPGGTINGNLVVNGVVPGLEALNVVGNANHAIHGIGGVGYAGVWGSTQSGEYYGLVGHNNSHSFYGVGRLENTGRPGVPEYSAQFHASPGNAGSLIGYSPNTSVYGILGYQTTHCFYGAGNMYVGGDVSVSGTLQVTGNVGFGGVTTIGAFGQLYTGSTYMQVGTAGAQVLGFHTNGINRMTLDTNGCLGLANTTPTAPEHVTSKTYVDNVILTRAGVNANYDWLLVYDPGTRYTGVVNLHASFGPGVFMVYISDGSRYIVITHGGGGATLEMRSGAGVNLDTTHAYSADNIRRNDIGDNFGILQIYKLRKLA